MNFTAMDIDKLVIHPAIGVARVGDAPIEDHFIGPERPLVPSASQDGGKNARGEIRRQGARFRVYAYDGAGKLLGEVTSSPDVTIAWRVHMVNSKAASPTTSPDSLNGAPRNPTVTGPARAGLVIDPGPRTLAGPNEWALFDHGKFTHPGFPTVDVSLGGMHTDDEGRLVVVAAAGKSASPDPDAQIEGFYDNPRWYDDVADGPVTATVTIQGRRFEAEGAWVLSAPPDYAAFIATPRSLYDHLIASHWPPAPGQPGNGGRPSYTRDVYPILARAAGLKWVRDSGEPNDLDLPAAHDADDQTRRKIADATNKLPGQLTAVQRDILRMWVAGDYERDWAGAPPPGPITPDGLDRAALEGCVGGAFYPGIEAGVWVDDRSNFGSRLRIKAEPGDVTQRMALPWQADFHQCSGDDWWPAQRPNTVIVPGHADKLSWDRGTTMRSMVDDWAKLGFVVPGDAQQIEVGRAPLPRHDELAHLLTARGMNPEEWLPTVERLLKQTHRKPHPGRPNTPAAEQFFAQAGKLVEALLAGE